MLNISLDDFLTQHKKKILYSSDGCWLWCGCRGTKGYASVTINKVTYYVHRLLYALQKQKDYSSFKQLHHKCLITCCINPDHLEEVAGTDHKTKYHQTFSLKESREIIDLYLYGYNQVIIAEWFNVSNHTIRDLLRKEGIRLRTRSEAKRKYTTNKVVIYDST